MVKTRDVQPVWDRLWIHARLATMATPCAEDERINNGALAVKDGRIAWLGSMSELPADTHQMAEQVIDLQNQWLTPGLIDCHTHLIYAGNRAAEFELRLKGASYEALARAGAGIISTVHATRNAAEQQLFASAAQRLQTWLAEGVTTVEIKSGYGLETQTELRMLRVARSLATKYPVDVYTSFLAAHALAPEYQHCRDDYIERVCEHMLPLAASHGLVDAVDAFCDGVGFSAREVERVFCKAQSLGLPVKLHADQLNDSQGAALSARFQALSADHLEYSNTSGIAAMAQAGTVAVLLPGPFYFLRETRLPPVEHLRQARVPVAIATDANPGSSPTCSLLLMMNMACTLFQLTPREVWRAVTCNAARALGLTDRGTLATGQQADMAVWAVEELAEVCYWMGHQGPTQVIKAGNPVRGELTFTSTMQE